MSDLFGVGVPGQNLNVADDNTTLSTGDLRRKYNFGSRVSELAIAQDPFFRFLSKVSKQATDDPQFKWTEKRGSWHKRYAYAVAIDDNSGSMVNDAALDGALSATNYASGITVRFATDYASAGNRQNVFGQTNNEIFIGDDGTSPAFFLPNQLVKIPTAGSAGGAVTDYAVVRIKTATTIAAAGSKNTYLLATDNRELVECECEVVKDSADSFLAMVGANYDAGTESIAGDVIASSLEPKRSYVVGSAFAEGSGYPETWKDQPYSTGVGVTQIFKTAMAMTNSARATVLKYESSEWARVWKEKLIEHKWDIEQSLLFGSFNDNSDSAGINYTQGAVDYILNNGNIFDLDIATKSSDDFLEDMSSYVDPRYNNVSSTLFFCSTGVYNWLHKLGGYFKNNLEISPNYRADLALTGKKKVFGVDISTFSTPYGDMNVAKNIHLDGTNIQMIGANMKYCKYRPLSGNGVNRDTSVYVGVQTLENSGIDRRVDLILTEAGMQWEMPECHAVWKA